MEGPQRWSPLEDPGRTVHVMAREKDGDVDGDQPGTWVVSVTTNMSMDEADIDDTTEVVENDDGTRTYTKRVRRSPEA